MSDASLYLWGFNYPALVIEWLFVAAIIWATCCFAAIGASEAIHYIWNTWRETK
jgi:hypothetical protein